MYARARFLLSFIFITVLSAAAQAQLRCEDAFTFSPPVLRNSHVQFNQFTTTRGLTEYGRQLPFEKTDSIYEMVDRLPKNSVWVDMGAGEARAVVEGLARNSDIEKALAISFLKPKTSVSANERFRYLDGAIVETMMAQGRLDDLRGRVSLITDVYGPMSYSEHLPRVLQAYVDLLKVDGVMAFNVLMKKNFNEFGATREFRAMNAVDDMEDGLEAWLSSIPGVEVVEISRAVNANGAQLVEVSKAYKLRKITSDVSIPRNLSTTDYDDNEAPPRRAFRVTP